MLIRITRGLGGRHGITILGITIVVGLVILLFAQRARMKMLAPRGIAVSSVPIAEMTRLGDAARGSQRDLPYMSGDMARVITPAVAKFADGRWQPVPDGTVLQVKSTRIESGDSWVNGTMRHGKQQEEIEIHGSFLTRYLPVVLDQKVEFSEMKLLHRAEQPVPLLSVSGCLRNITSVILTQCVVTCYFKDRNGREVDARRSRNLELPPFEVVPFETSAMEVNREFRSITVQITLASPDGLRDYLSSVVVQRSSLEGEP